jgi:hypothetical protein
MVGAQLKPGTQTRLLIIGCIVGELDAEMSPTGKADNEHRLIDARKLNGPYRTAQDRPKALSQLPAPVRAREDMHIAAKSDHDVTGLSCRYWSHPQNTAPQQLHPPTRPNHGVLSCRGQGRAQRARREALAMPMWSVGSRELCQPWTEDDGKPVTQSNLSLRAAAQRAADLDGLCPVDDYRLRRADEVALRASAVQIWPM